MLVTHRIKHSPCRFQVMYTFVLSLMKLHESDSGNETGEKEYSERKSRAWQMVQKLKERGFAVTLALLA